MSRYLDLIEESFNQKLDEIDKAYNNEIERDLKEEEYYCLEDEYTDHFFEIGRDFPDFLLSSFIIAWYSFIEQNFADICKSLNLETESKKNENEKGISRSRKLLLEVAKYEIEPAHWQELVRIRQLRNFIVHSGSRVYGTLSKSNRKENDKEIELVSHLGNKYYFSIRSDLFNYLQKHEIFEQTDSVLNISLTFIYCRHLIEFAQVLLKKLHLDLDAQR